MRFSTPRDFSRANHWRQTRRDSPIRLRRAPRIILKNSASFPAAIIMCSPSPATNPSNGAMRTDGACRAAPAIRRRRRRPIALSSIATWQSSMPTSTMPPRPLCARRCSAAKIPASAKSPAEMSPMEVPTRTGGPALAAGDAHDAAHRLRHQIVCRQIAARPALPETGNRRIHQSRIHFAQRRPVVVEFAHHPGAVVFHQHIGARRQFFKNRAVLRRFQIQRDAAFAAVYRREIRRAPVRKRPKPPRIIPARRLHFNDPRAHLGEHHGGVGAGEGAG